MRAAGLAVIACFLLAGPARAEKVRYVVDGDTFILENNQRVRMIGINAPEIGNRKYGKKAQPYGRQARDHLRDMIEGAEVRLEDGPELFDRFGRRLAYVYLADGTLVNARMIEDGYAEAMRKFSHPRKEAFEDLERQARSANKPMWKAGVRPWWEVLLDPKFWEWLDKTYVRPRTKVLKV